MAFPLYPVVHRQLSEPNDLHQGLNRLRMADGGLLWT
jgi:hypothetical protein